MAKPFSYVEMLAEAIRKAYGCESKHTESVAVHEVHQGNTLWKGTVEVFDLIDHPKSKRAYGWGHAEKYTGNEVRVVTVLGISPVDSPLTAVRASILHDIKGLK